MNAYQIYKTTQYEWLGDIPEHWEWLFLSQVCRSQEVKNTGNVEKNVLSLSYGRIIRKKDINFGLVPKDYNGYQIVDKGNIILRLTDLQNDHRSLRTGLVRERGIITSAYTCLVPFHNPEYLQLLLHAYDIHKYFYGLGGGVRQSIGFPDIRYMFVPLPPRPEQDRIVAYLDAITAMCAKFTTAKKREIECLKELKKAVVSRAVTEGGAGWATHRFGEYFELGKGLSITKADLRSEGIPCVSYGQIHSKFGFEVKADAVLPFVEEFYLKTSEKSLLKRGDFVFADTSEDVQGSGNFTYLNSDTPTFAGYHTVIARLKKDVNPRYVAYLFDSEYFRTQIQISVNAVKVYSITRTILNGTTLLLPPPEEQSHIVAYLDEQYETIDAMIARITREIELVAEYKTRTISDAVTGKIDLRNVEIPDFVPINKTESEEESEDEND